ncbi:phosphorylase superfamily protein [Colletotrichum camelliae]|nr:phosphorylase superfamily protein [Colletotrichum camelliae]
MDPITIITTTLGFVGTIVKSYNVIREIRELPEAFREVERQLPLVQRILSDVRQRLANSQTTDADRTTLENLIVPCQNDAKTLKDIFEKLEEGCKKDQDGIKAWAKARAWYREALRGTKAHRVESLMKTILDRVQLLASKELFDAHDYSVQIMEALDKISKVDASLDDSELEMGAIHASQTIQDNARGTQYNTAGGIVNTGDNSGNTFGNIGTLTFKSTGQTMATRQGHDKSRPIHLIPLNENENFVGRVETLKKLRAMLTGTQRQRVALHGLGGVGKTQTALSLAYWTQENMPGYSVFWLSALSMANFEQSCRDVISSISLPCPQGQNPPDVLRNFLSSETSGLWLLIIDNLDDESIVFGDGGINRCLPKPRDRRSLIIFTTRSRKIARELSNFNVLQIQEMDKDEAKTLLETLLGPRKLQDKDTTIASLLEELTYLPLAINHAAAYIDQNGISAKAQEDATLLIDPVYETYTTVDIYQDRMSFAIALVLAERLSEINRTSAATKFLEMIVEKHGVVIGRCSPELIEAQFELSGLYSLGNDDD